VAIVIQLLLPNSLDLFSKWVLPVIETVMLVMLFVISPEKLTGPHSLRHRMSITVAALASIANGIALVELSTQLLRHDVDNGHQLIIAGVAVWLSNVLIFSLWYWNMDAGGPGRRAEGSSDEMDFLFPQTGVPEARPGWRPFYPDYLYVALTNATAFSPTDAMPLSITAKMVMSLQSLISLVTMGLVIARAVNIL
jgi:uncharacterized membrane protein